MSKSNTLLLIAALFSVSAHADPKATLILPSEAESCMELDQPIQIHKQKARLDQPISRGDVTLRAKPLKRGDLSKNGYDYRMREVEADANWAKDGSVKFRLSAISGTSVEIEAAPACASTPRKAKCEDYAISGIVKIAPQVQANMRENFPRGTWVTGFKGTVHEISPENACLNGIRIELLDAKNALSKRPGKVTLRVEYFTDGTGIRKAQSASVESERPIKNSDAPASEREGRPENPEARSAEDRAG